MRNYEHIIQCGIAGEAEGKPMGFMEEARGKPYTFRGSRPRRHSFLLRFWGKLLRPVTPFIILKRGKRQAVLDFGESRILMWGVVVLDLELLSSPL